VHRARFGFWLLLTVDCSIMLIIILYYYYCKYYNYYYYNFYLYTYINNSIILLEQLYTQLQ